MSRRLSDPQRATLQAHQCPKCGEKDRIAAERGFAGWLLNCLRCGKVVPMK